MSTEAKRPSFGFRHRGRHTDKSDETVQVDLDDFAATVKVLSDLIKSRNEQKDLEISYINDEDILDKYYSSILILNACELGSKSFKAKEHTDHVCDVLNSNIYLRKYGTYEDAIQKIIDQREAKKRDFTKEEKRLLIEALTDKSILRNPKPFAEIPRMSVEQSHALSKRMFARTDDDMVQELYDDAE